MKPHGSWLWYLGERGDSCAWTWVQTLSPLIAITAGPLCSSVTLLRFDNLWLVEVSVKTAAPLCCNIVAERCCGFIASGFRPEVSFVTAGPLLGGSTLLWFYE